MNIALFFTYGVSLRVWAEAGLIEREVLLYMRLAEKGVKVVFITYGDKEDYKYQEQLGSIEIVPLYAHTRKPKSRWVRMFHSLLLPFVVADKIKNADILKTNQMWGSWVVVLSKYLYKKKIIIRCGVEEYGNALKARRYGLSVLLWKNLSRYSYKLGDRVILSSLGMAEFVVERFGIDRRKIVVVSNYVDVKSFRPLGLVRGRRILFVGRLASEKNIFSLLEAIAGGKYELDMVGDGYLRREIEGYIRTHNVGARLLGRVSNMELPALMNKYRVYVLCSYFEGNPKSLLEAMACGLGVIGTDVEGIREVIRDRETGLLCDGSPESIGRAIRTLMEDEELQRRLGKKAREFVTANCDLERVAEQEHSLYAAMLREER